MSVKITNIITNQNVITHFEKDYSPSLGIDDALQRLDKETKIKILNPVRDFETVRYEHKRTGTKSDFYLCFNFHKSGTTWVNDYVVTGLNIHENIHITKEDIHSFFKLEFYNSPSAENQKLLFSKIFPMPFGNKLYDSTVDSYIHIPSFSGNQIEKSENFFLYWFQDNPIYTGNTFYVTAKYYNSLDGKVVAFLNKEKQSITTGFIQEEDRYYICEINKSDYTYCYYEYDGSKGARVGDASDNCVLFSEVAYV